MELVKWQKEFVERFKVLNGNAILWCETGLGKSVVATYISSKLQNVFVVVPPHLIYDWVDKLEDWGVTEDKINILKKTNTTFIENKINIMSLKKLTHKSTKLKNFNKKLNSSILIVDECHNIKNYKSVGFKLLDGIRDNFKFTLLISATLIGKNTIDYYTYTALVNTAFRSKYGSKFNDFARENVEWKQIQMGSGKTFVEPVRIFDASLEKYIYPCIYTQSYEGAGVIKPTYNFKNIYFEFSTHHTTEIKNLKSKMVFELNGEKVNIDEVGLENLTFEQLDKLTQKIHNTHPLFYQLLNCVQYNEDVEVFCSTIDEIKEILQKNPNLEGYITYHNEVQKNMLLQMGLTEKKRSKVYIKKVEQLNEMMWIHLDGDYTYYDIEDKIDVLESLVESRNKDKGYLTFYFNAEREMLSKFDWIFMYDSDKPQDLQLEAFKNSKTHKILATQISQLGEGIRLKFCDYIVEFSLFYNLISVLQSRGRLGYAGCTKIIDIYSIIPRDKNVKKIVDNIQSKLKLHTEEFNKKL